MLPDDQVSKRLSSIRAGGCPIYSLNAQAISICNIPPEHYFAQHLVDPSLPLINMSSTIQIPHLPPVSRSSSTQSLPSLRSFLESGPSSHRFGKFHSESDQDMEELDDEGEHDDSETMMQRLRLRTRVCQTILS